MHMFPMQCQGHADQESLVSAICILLGRHRRRRLLCHRALGVTRLCLRHKPVEFLAQAHDGSDDQNRRTLDASLGRSLRDGAEMVSSKPLVSARAGRSDQANALAARTPAPIVKACRQFIVSVIARSPKTAVKTSYSRLCFRCNVKAMPIRKNSSLLYASYSAAVAVAGSSAIVHLVSLACASGTNQSSFSRRRTTDPMMRIAGPLTPALAALSAMVPNVPLNTR